MGDFLEVQPHASLDPDAIAEIFASLAVAAGAVIMDVYAGQFGVRRKEDQSPVCDADERAEQLILAGLAAAFPDIPVIAEEAVSRGDVPPCGRAFILVDPVDGTREFVSRNGEFTVNIALILDGAPCAGAVYAPAIERLWVAGHTASRCKVAPGATVPPGTARERIRARSPSHEGLIALSSRSHIDPETSAYLEKLPVIACRSAGSSLKFCLIAEGGADIYPRFGPTMEWDTAAGDAILRAAGGRLVGSDGQLLRYGKPLYKNGAFVAWGRSAT